MNRAAIERVIQAQGFKPSFRPVNEHNVRIFANEIENGQHSRAIGYLREVEQMNEWQLVDRIHTAYARKAR
jgi:hypothetical protein